MSKGKVDKQKAEGQPNSSEVENDDIKDIVEDDIQEEDEVKEVERLPNPREEMMKNIIDARNSERLPVADDDESGEFDVNQERVDKPAKVANNFIISEGDEQYLQLKVNGVEQKMPLKDAIANLQKSGSADQKLKQAALLLKQAEEKARQTHASTPPDDVRRNAVESKESLKNALTKLYDGDIDEATDELSRVFSDGRGQSSTPDIGSLVDARIAAREDDDKLQSAYKNFQSNDDYKHILDDDTLSNKLDTITAELQQDPEFLATNPTYDDYFNEAGERVNKWLGTLTNHSTKPTSETSSVNALKKRKGEGIQTMTVRRAPPSQPKPRTREDILADMAAKRGQNI